MNLRETDRTELVATYEADGFDELLVFEEWPNAAPENRWTCFLCGEPFAWIDADRTRLWTASPTPEEALACLRVAIEEALSSVTPKQPVTKLGDFPCP